MKYVLDLQRFADTGTVAISDVGTMLYVQGTGADAKYTQLINIISTSAEGSAGGTIEVTTLDSPVKQYIPDRPEIPEQDFNYNYTEARRALVNAVCDGAVHNFLVKFQDGSGYVITGIAQTWANENGRGGAQEATLHIVATNIAWKTKTEVDALITT